MYLCNLSVQSAAVNDNMYAAFVSFFLPDENMLSLLREKGSFSHWCFPQDFRRGLALKLLLLIATECC